MDRSACRRRFLALFSGVLRSATPWIAMLLLFMRLGTALAQGVVVQAEGVSPERAEATAKGALHIVNELANRRRLTTFFPNEQSPFYGVQINYVNVGRGNLTFLNRDLVRLDRIPIVAGRVYDSRLEAESDFGPGWKLSVSEFITHHGDTLRYIDASGSVYELQLEGTRIVSRYPHLTGISGGRRQSGDIELRTSNLTKRFTNIRGDFYLSTVTDNFGNSLRLHYSGTRIGRISSENGRYVEMVRDTSGRIVSMRDDAGRAVKYQYDTAGQLYSVRGAGGQWRYRYDANGHLQAATDPRGIDALTAGSARDGRVGNIKVLYDQMSFSYQGSATAVRNGLQQAATFWHDQSGLTTTIQDLEGATTQVAFDNALRPVSLSFNGSVVAELRYGENGKIQTLRSSIEGRPRLSRVRYDGAGRPASIVADDQQIARYKYDSAGRVLRAEDAAGARSYEYFGASGYQVGFGQTEIDVETNRFGLMKGFSNGHQSVDVSYNALDQVRELNYLRDGEVYTSDYDYGGSGLRSAGEYKEAGEPARATLSLDYDVVGNLTNLGVEGPSGERSSQTYVLGMNNQLTRLMNPQRPDVVFEYDDAGKPTRRTLGNNDVSHTFDALGRITAVYQRGRRILEWRYGPMDVDAATEADDHTPWTAINEPIASAIFGSAESIAYARTRGTPFGSIRFNASMVRFVLATQLIPSGDAVTMVSLARRNVPLSSDEHAHVGPEPMDFDKPSNALFLPPEFSSLNCYMCVAGFIGGGVVLNINGSGGTPIVAAGTTETISMSGSAQCWSDIYHYYEYQYSELAETTHYFDFGDGYWSYAGSGSSVIRTVYTTHNAPGLYTVRGEVGCGCLPYGVWDVLADEQDVVVVPPPSTVYIRLTFDDGPAIYGNQNTQKVYNALQTNTVQNNIQATFFVQTHVWNRGGDPLGRQLMSQGLTRGHGIMIHTGSDEDHARHDERAALAAYAGGQNALESDLIRAKARIEALPGPIPIYVRPPGGFGQNNSTVLATYSRQQLTMKLWDVRSFDDDDAETPTVETISAHLTAGITQAISGNDTDIIILFHDIQQHTADNMLVYLQVIKTVAQSLGYTVVFTKL